MRRHYSGRLVRMPASFHAISRLAQDDKERFSRRQRHEELDSGLGRLAAAGLRRLRDVRPPHRVHIDGTVQQPQANEEEELVASGPGRTLVI